MSVAKPQDKPKPRPDGIVKAGVYWVQSPGLPRKLIDTAQPDSVVAREVAVKEYLEGYDLRPRPGREFAVELAE